MCIFAVMRALISSIFLLALCSCLDTPPCIDSQTSSLTIEFKSIIDGSNKTINIDSVYIVSPDMVVEKEVDLAEVSVPVPPDMTSFLIVFQSQELEDSISINYKVTPKLFAQDCDVELLFTDFGLDYTTADSLRISLDEIPPRIEVFF